MMESIIDGIMKAQIEAERRCIHANAVMINDAMFVSKLNIYPYIGEPKLICGLRAFYNADLPSDVLFAVCEVSTQKEKPCETELLPITREELHYLQNDVIAYIWRMEDSGRNKEEFGYFDRKALYEKLKQFENDHFSSLECATVANKAPETPSVTADAVPPPSEREADGRSRTPAPTEPEQEGDDGK